MKTGDMLRREDGETHTPTTPTRGDGGKCVTFVTTSKREAGPRGMCRPPAATLPAPGAPSRLPLPER